ncbi:MAG: alkaline phosphatase family protein [Bryobacteraceae bacterium]|nr:alkaline phosphatase family protein [Bryobacteraceae bacterium]
MGRALLLAALLLPYVHAQVFRPPASERTAARRPGAESILPGGRIVAPLGQTFATGPGPFGLALSAGGSYVVTSNGGPNRYSLTVLKRDGDQWRARQIDTERGPRKDEEPDEWRSVFMGLAFRNDDELFASEGNSGKVRLVNAGNGKTIEVFHLNQGTFRDSYTGDLAYDSDRQLLYVLDQANFRLAILDVKRRAVVSSVRVGRLPFALALSPDKRRVYVTNIGMFAYQPIPGADRKNARETGLPFPAFGFPSAEAEKGARRDTARGPVDVPGLGSPNVEESNSLAVVDVADPAAARVIAWVRTGKPFGASSFGGSSPSGVLATKDRIYVSNGHNDSVSIVDAAKLTVAAEIPIRIPKLEGLRGVLPIGLAYHPGRNWLLVAEAGVNAVGVIDIGAGKVIGHIPAAWFPTRIQLDGDTVYVSNAKGHGTGPNADRQKPLPRSFQGELRRGALTRFELPAPAELGPLTTRVLDNNGFRPTNEAPAPLPAALKHVVIIVKENRTYDEIFGDIEKASNGEVRGAPDLARWGRRGLVQSAPGLQNRTVLKSVNVTPNHRALAERFAFSDNFYADSEVSVDGHHWIVGSYPNAWTESSLMASYGGQKDFRLPTSAPGRLSFAQSNSSVHPEEQLEAGALWHHLDRHGVSFRNFGEGFELAGADEGEGLKPTGARYLTNVPMPDPLFRNTSREYAQYNTNIPDQFRADQFIAEMRRLYLDPGKELPRLIFIHLPNDHTDKPRPEDGYPFDASYVADNDYALGRIVEFLSKTPAWKQMAIFVTEDDAQGGVDHIDSHRTVFLLISPYARKNYVLRNNASFPSILKTSFRILGLPSLNLFDASAADLAEAFQNEPDVTPFEPLPVHPQIFDPATAREPKDPVKPARMDDPSVLRRQHLR